MSSLGIAWTERKEARVGDVTPDSPGFDRLRLESIAEDHRMLERFAEHWRDGSNRFDRPGELILGARLDGELIGICGRNRAPFDPSTRAGRVRHLYVAAAHRRSGVGRALIDAIVDGASQWFDYLNTNCPPEAAPFYERLGFAPLPADRITHRLHLTMLTRANADELVTQHLGDSSRAAHSRLVASLMRALTSRLATDADRWEITGLCHDLDYEVTRATPERHGLVTAGWLRFRLPADALRAIEAHDRLTGVASETSLAHALKLADALSLLPQPDLPAALRSPDPRAQLFALAGQRPWLASMILDNASALGLTPTDLAAALAEE